MMIAFCKSLLSKAAEASIKIINPLDLVSPDLSAYISKILCQSVSLRMDQINTDYMTPLDTRKRNSPDAPLYSQSAIRYVLLPKALAARALYEAIYRLLREAQTANLDNIMGKTLELLTADAIECIEPRPDLINAKYDSKIKKNLFMIFFLLRSFFKYCFKN